jgi:hypothetical protein
MDIVTQMQDQVNHIASLFFNHVGTLQRDAPPAPIAKKAKQEQATEVSLMLGFDMACRIHNGGLHRSMPCMVLTLFIFQGSCAEIVLPRLPELQLNHVLFRLS